MLADKAAPGQQHMIILTKTPCLVRLGRSAEYHYFFHKEGGAAVDGRALY